MAREKLSKTFADCKGTDDFTRNFPYQGDQVDQERIAWIQEDFGGISAKFLEGFSSQSFMSSLQLELDCQLLQYK